VLLLALVPAVAFAAQGTGHGDPLGSVVLALTIILVAAKLGGELAVRLGQSGVLGELVVGVLLGNLTLVGYPGLDHLWIDPSIDMLARLGVLILLFEVGLESTVGQMLKVGLPPCWWQPWGRHAFALGWGVGAWLLPEHSVYVHAFLGATLCATSVAITARVLKDLNRLQTREARIILGAAVLDDVMGLVVLAVVTGMIGRRIKEPHSRSPAWRVSSSKQPLFSWSLCFSECASRPSCSNSHLGCTPAVCS